MGRRSVGRKSKKMYLYGDVNYLEAGDKPQKKRKSI